MTEQVEKVPTLEQQAIMAAIKERKESLMIKALAGCAKTSTIEMSSPLLKGTTLALAFNVKTKDELIARLPKHFTVLNFNGLGHRAFGQAIGKRLQVKDGKQFEILKDLAKEDNSDLSPDDFSDILALVESARNAGVILEGGQFSGRTLLPDEWDTWEWLADEKMIELTQFKYALARRVLARSVKMAFAGVVDFTDQIYMSALFSGIFPKFQNIIVDEAQDLSGLNHIQVRKCFMSSATRLICVGDPRQAIYAFRGADSSSMDKLRMLSPAWTDLPLTTTFRCSKAVVERQRIFVPEFNAWSGAKDGAIVDLRLASWDLGRIPKHGSLAVLCRNNAPMVAFALKLLARGIGVTILGRDIGKSLIRLVQKICGSDLSLPTSACALKIEAWATREIDKAHAKGQNSKVAGIADRQDALLAIADDDKARNLGDIVNILQRLFAENTAKVTLATGHRAKGLEWDHVIHLNPNLVPSKYAREALENGNPVPHEQDMNLKYVIETRAKDTLILAHLDDFEKGE